MKKFIFAVVAIHISIFGICGSARAGDMRMVSGSTCGPHEKTYFDKDGLTPFACETLDGPSSGPGYVVTVYENEKQIWAANIKEDQDAVYSPKDLKIDIGGNSPAMLVLRRCFTEKANDTGLFVGVSYLSTLSKYENPNGMSVQIPEMETQGQCLTFTENVKNNSVSMKFNVNGKVKVIGFLTERQENNK